MSKISRSKIVLFSSLSATAAIAAIAVPLIHQQFGLAHLNNDFSNTKEGNKNKILAFINDNKKINQSMLTGQLKIDEEKHSYSDRSFVTVDEAFQQGWFDFQINSAFDYNLYKSDLNARLAYVKANSTNSTYPIVGLKIYAGQAETYSEIIYEYSESSLGGFKQTGEELIINSIVNDINNDPKKYFLLKEDVGNFGDLGLYAKNIKSEDFEFIKNKLIKQLKENNYFIDLTNVEVDNVIPSNLNLTYDVTFDNGETQFKKTYNKAVISGLDIEFGVDDPVWKVKNFIKENKDSLLTDLYQYFEYDEPGSETDKPEEKPYQEAEKLTIDDAYQKNLIKFNSKNENIYNISNAGLFLEFRTYQQTVQLADNNPSAAEKSVFPSPFDSTTPMYRLFLTSYKGTPREYTESFVIEGTKQEGKFKISETQKKMEKLDNLLDELNLDVDNFLEIESVTLEGPLKQEKPNNPSQPSPFVDFQSTDIPFVILKNAYEKYKEDDFKYDIPFDFKLKVNKKPLDDIKNKTQKDELNDLLNKVVEQINKLTIKDKLEGIVVNENQNFYQFKVNVVMGEKDKDLFISTQNYGLVKVDETQFKDENQYFKKQVDEVAKFLNGGTAPNGTPNASNNNKKYIKINIAKNDNGEQISQANAVELMKQAQWNKIFTSVSVYNVPDNIIDFPDFDEFVKIDIDFDDLAKKDWKEIDKIIKDKKLTINLIVSKHGQSQKVPIEFNFSDLFV